jgi:hypothetical protein
MLGPFSAHHTTPQVRYHPAQGYVRLILAVQLAVFYVWGEARFIIFSPPSTTDYPPIPAQDLTATEAMCNCFGNFSETAGCSDPCKMKMKKQKGLIRLLFLAQVGPIIWAVSDFPLSISENNPDGWEFSWFSDADDQCLTPDPSKCPS